MNRQINTCPIGSIPYEIKSGDTLSSIATQYYTTEETILSINPELEPYNLNVGQVICIKQEMPDVPECPAMNFYVINQGDTLTSIATSFGISVESLVKLNNQIDPFNLIIGTIICLPLTPTPYIIVVNTSNRTLYLYYLGQLQKSYRVAIGTQRTPTPKGEFYIFNKQVNPGGPFGSRWLGLSEPSYGIHGTNRPELIGMAVSNGCIRMHNADVEKIFSKVSIYTPVIIL